MSLRTSKVVMAATAIATASLAFAASALANPSGQDGAPYKAYVEQFGVANVDHVTMTFNPPAVSSTRSGYIAEAFMDWPQHNAFAYGGYRVTYDTSGVEQIRPYFYYYGSGSSGVLAPLTVQANWNLKVGIFPLFEGNSSAANGIQINWTRLLSDGSEQLLATRTFTVDDTAFTGDAYAAWGMELAQNSNGGAIALTPVTVTLTGDYATRSGLANQPIAAGGSAQAYEMTTDGLYHGNACGTAQSPNPNRAVVIAGSVASSPDDGNIVVKACPAAGVATKKGSDGWEW